MGYEVIGIGGDDSAHASWLDSIKLAILNLLLNSPLVFHFIKTFL